MRTYQPTVVGSTRKIVVIACLPQNSVAQIAQISELPTVRGAPAHSVATGPGPTATHLPLAPATIDKTKIEPLSALRHALAEH